jgi:hypothetical protein
MSIKALVESIEQARINNRNFGSSVEGRMNAVINDLTAAQHQFDAAVANLVNVIEEAKKAIALEFSDRDEDLVKLMEGAV